jgi:hypothetical protein
MSVQKWYYKYIERATNKKTNWERGKHDTNKHTIN